MVFGFLRGVLWVFLRGRLLALVVQDAYPIGVMLVRVERDDGFWMSRRVL